MKLIFSAFALAAATLPFCSASAPAPAPIVSTYTFTNPYIYESYVNYPPYLIDVTTETTWTQTRTFYPAVTNEPREHARDFS